MAKHPKDAGRSALVVPKPRPRTPGGAVCQERNPGARGRWSGRLYPLAICATLLATVFLVPASPALAAEGTPQWTVSSVSRPTNFKPGGDAGGDAYLVIVTNTGGEPSAGPITITDELPAGLAPAPGASGFDELASKQQCRRRELQPRLRTHWQRLPQLYLQRCRATR